MEFLLIRYGYLLLFLGVALEGETFLLAGAYLAHRGYFHLLTVICVAVAGNFLADQAYYFAARTHGRAWLEKRFSHNLRYQKVLEMVRRHGNWLLLGSRYAFGFRIIIPAACGALGMPALRFSLINLVAGIIWAVPTAFLGFYFGRAAETLLGQLRHYEISALLAVALTLALLLSLRHLRRIPFVRDLELSDFHSLVPMVIGLMGLINLWSAIFPHPRASILAVEHWLPLEVIQRSRPLMMFAGVALLQVTNSLVRRKALAWYAATIALSVTLLLHITRGFDVHHSLVAAILLGYLIYHRRRFYARSDPALLKWGLLMIPLLGFLVYLYGYIGLSHLAHYFRWDPGATPAKEAFRSGILILEPQLDPITAHAARYLGSLQIAGWLARFYVLVLLLRPVILRSRMEASAEAVSQVFRKHSRHSLSAFAVQTDKHHLLVAGRQGLVAYATRGSVAITCGDPVCPEEHLKACVQEFLDFALRNGWKPCFYEAAEVHLPIYHDLGLKSLKIAEEALVDLPHFGLSGNARAGLRAMVNKAAKSGMEVVSYFRNKAPDPGVDEQLEEISEEWLEEKHLGELGFTLGRFSLEALSEIPVFVCKIGDKLEAFCSWLPYRGGQAVVLDLMRKRRGALAGTMDFLLAHSLMQLRDMGLQDASLANAPLANVAEPKGTLDRGVALLFENMNAFYGYKNLFRFKKKFVPRWEGRYLVYPAGSDLPRVAYALTSLHSSGGLWRFLFRR